MGSPGVALWVRKVKQRVPAMYHSPKFEQDKLFNASIQAKDLCCMGFSYCLRVSMTGC